jgi:hypothetical protein
MWRRSVWREVSWEGVSEKEWVREEYLEGSGGIGFGVSGGEWVGEEYLEGSGGTCGGEA